MRSKKRWALSLSRAPDSRGARGRSRLGACPRPLGFLCLDHVEKLDSQRRAHARSPLRPQRALQPTRDETILCGEAFPPQGPPMDCPGETLLARVPRRYLGRRTAFVHPFIQILSRRKACRKNRERLRSSCPEGPSSRSEHVALGAPLRYPDDGHVVQPSPGHEGCRTSVRPTRDRRRLGLFKVD